MLQQQYLPRVVSHKNSLKLYFTTKLHCALKKNFSKFKTGIGKDLIHEAI